MRSFHPCCRLIFTCLIGLAWLLSAAVSQPAFAVQLTPISQPDDATKRSIRFLLESEWSLSGRASVKKAFAETEPTNAATALAYAIHQYRFESVSSGLAISQSMNARFPENLDGWMLTLWHQALSDQYDRSLLTTGSFLKQFKKQASVTPTSKQLIYRRLGRLMGYFEFVVNESVNQDLLLTTKQKILDGISAEHKKVFEEARLAVKNKHDEMAKAQAAVAKVELEKIKVQDDEEIKRLEQDNTRLEETSSRLEPERQRISAQADREIGNLQSTADSALAQLNNANASAFAIEQDLALLYSQWNVLQRQIAQSNRQRNGQLQRFRFQDEIFLRNQIQQAEFALSQARTSAISFGNEVAALRNQIQRTRLGFNNQISRLTDQINDLERARKKNTGRLRRLGRGPELAAGKISGRKNRLSSLKTYDEISLELIRQQLLDAIK